MWVVKLGGSLVRTEHLRDWLETLDRYGRGRVIIVPGGGPFAEQVRVAQNRWRFGDRIAHRMAVLAMDQYAWLLVGLRQTLVPAITEAAIQCVLEEAKTPVWVPSRMILNQPDIPQNWGVTSDSLAAWLTLKLGAEQLVLVKSVSHEKTGMSPSELQRKGIVDDAFPAFVKDARYSVHVLGRDDYHSIKRLMGAARSPAAPEC